MEYFEHNNECILEIIGRINSCDPVLYVLFVTMQINIIVFIIIIKIKGVPHISDIILKSGYYILYHQRLYY